MFFTRRTFCTSSAAAFTSLHLYAFQGSPRPSTRPDVLSIDRDRILSQAHNFAFSSPDPLTAHPAPNSPGSPNDFYSEDPGTWPDPPLPDPTVNPASEVRASQTRSGSSLASKLNPKSILKPSPKSHSPTAPAAATPAPSTTPLPAAFTAHRQALLNLALAVPALTSASIALRTSDPTQSSAFAAKAIDHLHAWFIDPATRMSPSLNFGLIDPKKPDTPRFEGIVEAIQLVEVAQSIPFLLSSPALTAADASALFAWFAQYLDWLNTSRLAGLARDQRNHHASSWLLQACSCAVLAAFHPDASRAPAGHQPDDAIAPLRHLFKATTLRSQIYPDGSFPRELSTPWPYRLSLFNLDMLAAVCQLLSTRFDSLWDYALQDGPGMRVAIARHFPFMLQRDTWPYPADASRFTELPLRQPSLLFASRPYLRPEYADLWRTLPPDPSDPVLQQTFPIRQPLLWTTRPVP